MTVTEPVDADAQHQHMAHQLGDALAEAFTAYTAETQADRDPTALTMSGLGGCTRQAAYRLAGTPPTEPIAPRQQREANIGTMLHAGLLPHLAQLTGGHEEIAVTLTAGGLRIDGRTDLYSPDWRLVGDLKTVGPHRMSGIGQHAPQQHRVQVAGYATAVSQAGYPVEWVAWLYLDRASGTEHVVLEPFTDDVVTLVEDRCREIATYAAEPDTAPRDERGPGLSIICDQCPWLRQCWGADARPGEVGAQRILAHDHAGVAEALRLYDDARAREKKAAADKEFARAMFSDYESGQYGGYRFAWSKPRESPDKDAAVRMLTEAGIPVPTKQAGRRLIVEPAREPSPTQGR